MSMDYDWVQLLDLFATEKNFFGIKMQYITNNNGNRGPRPSTLYHHATSPTVTSTIGGTQTWIICGVNGCRKQCKTYIGRVRHITHCHKNYANAARRQARTQSTLTPHIRWRTEESELLALLESTLDPMLSPIAMAKSLHDKFDRRSRASIIAQRRKATHKAAVSRYRTEQTAAVPPTPVPSNIIEEPADAYGLAHLRALITPNCKFNRDVLAFARRAELGEIIGAAEFCTFLEANLGKKRVRARTQVPINIPRRRGHFTPTRRRNHRSKKKKSYVRTQQLWQQRLKRKVIIREILDKVNDSKQYMVDNLDQDTVMKDWKEIIERPSSNNVNDSREPIIPESYDLMGIWAPISVKDVKDNELKRKSACGTDGISVDKFSMLSPALRAMIFNIVMYCGGFSEEFLLGRTILIPKVVEPSASSQLRPLTIGSVVARQFNKILASRITSCHSWDERVRAFRPVDGAAENIALLNAMLEKASAEKRECHLAYLDLSKAFDSVEHEAIFDALARHGAPKGFMDYIKQSYGWQKTVLHFNERQEILTGKRGVRQGDPLSPVLFNLVMEGCIKQLKVQVGFELTIDDDTTIVNGLSFADDTIIVASSEVGLETSLVDFATAIEGVGLSLNAQKTKLLSIKKDGHRGPMYLAENGALDEVSLAEFRPIKFNDIELNYLAPEDLWKYLGVHFIGNKRLSVEERVTEFNTYLERVTNEKYLKPYQKVDMLRQYILPRFLNQLVLGTLKMRLLEELDKAVRGHLRKWLHLRTDVSSCCFYAPETHGGLGIMCLTTKVPVLMLRRYERALQDGKFLPKYLKATDTDKTIAKLKGVIARHTGDLAKTVPKDEEQGWVRQFCNSVDGNAMAEAHKCKASYNWLRASNTKLKGSDYIGVLKVRLNCLPTKARTGRGGAQARKVCRYARCRGKLETNFHAIQVCGKTHGGRVQRHNMVCKTLAKKLTKLKWTVLEELRVITPGGKLCIPDLVIIKQGLVVVVDVHVVGSNDIGDKHRRKTNKYRDISGFDVSLREALVGRNLATRNVAIEHVAATILYNGVWYEPSLRALKAIFNIKDVFFGRLARLAAIGSLRNYQNFVRD